MHPRISLSAISTYSWNLERDLAFYESAEITNIGASLAKLEGFGVAAGAERIRSAGLRVTNLIGVGPFQLDDRGAWPAQQDRVKMALDAALTIKAECLVLTTGPAGALNWEEAADALAEALQPVLADTRGIKFALEHTNSLRVDVGFVHTLADVLDLAVSNDIGVCMEINACWAERNLATTVRTHIDRLQLVQVSDFAIGTLSTPNRLVPGDGDIPIERILRSVLDAGYSGCFDLELIGPRIDEEGYEVAATRSIAALSEILIALDA